MLLCQSGSAELSTALVQGSNGYTDPVPFTLQ
jgi:hypothetical protein